MKKCKATLGSNLDLVSRALCTNEDYFFGPQKELILKLANELAAAAAAPNEPNGVAAAPATSAATTTASTTAAAQPRRLNARRLDERMLLLPPPPRRAHAAVPYVLPHGQSRRCARARISPGLISPGSSTLLTIFVRGADCGTCTPR